MVSLLRCDHSNPPRPTDHRPTCRHPTPARLPVSLRSSQPHDLQSAGADRTEDAPPLSPGLSAADPVAATHLHTRIRYVPANASRRALKPQHCGKKRPTTSGLPDHCGNLTGCSTHLPPTRPRVSRFSFFLFTSPPPPNHLSRVPAPRRHPHSLYRFLQHRSAHVPDHSTPQPFPSALPGALL